MNLKIDHGDNWGTDSPGLSHVVAIDVDGHIETVVEIFKVTTLCHSRVQKVEIFLWRKEFVPQRV